MGIIYNLPNIYLPTKDAIVSILHERNEGQFFFFFFFLKYNKGQLVMQLEYYYYFFD